MTGFQFVADHRHRHAVKRLCTILGIARSSFSYWRRTAPKRATRQARPVALLTSDTDDMTKLCGDHVRIIGL